ncbi:MAG: DUF2156 domain-containing protein [Clostridiales bacterium]|nr:DUF2156 domain-containing protein [Clostridiales bacterium]
MDKFKKITLDDREILAEYLNCRKHRACDYSVGNLVLWADVYNTHFAVAENMLFIRFTAGGRINFAFPMGTGDLKSAFNWLFSYCREQNIDFKMSLVEPDMFEDIEKIFPGRFEINYIRDSADYIYRTEDLKNLSGKKYHSKKNHINQFVRANPDWSYEKISDENIQECIEMVKEWCLLNKCRDDKSKADETCVLIKGLKNRKELGLIGGAVRAGGRIVALTLGEKSGDDMFIIHFEKAFADVPGAYPMIAHEFIAHELEGITYVNREEDMGIEGLRKAKESYFPAFMAEKGTLVEKTV